MERESKNRMTEIMFGVTGLGVITRDLNNAGFICME